MTRRDVEDIVLAVMVGAANAAFVGIVSIMIAAPRVWPGCLLALVTGGGGFWLLRSQRRRSQ